MKRIFTIGLLLILCALTGLAQEEIPSRTIVRQPQVAPSNAVPVTKHIYSKQNLEQASMEDLNQYLRKARIQRNEGFGMVVLGPALCVAGVLFLDASTRNKSKDDKDENVKSGFTFLGLGVACSAMSIPTIISGSARAGKVKKAMKDRTGAGLNLAPSLVYSDKSRNLSPGITLRVRF
jgi:hypothetical protein